MIRALIKSESSRGGGEVGFDASRQWKFNSCGVVKKEER